MPDDLLREVRALAAAKEWSLAETFRRSAELMLEVHGTPDSRDWVPPVSTKVGWKGLSPEELREAALRDADPTLSAP